MLPDFRVRQRDYLLEIARALAEELNFDKLLDRILFVSIEMLAGQAGFIALRSEIAVGMYAYGTVCPKVGQIYQILPCPNCEGWRRTRKI